MRENEILLAIETSGDTCAVAISQGDHLLYECGISVKNIHSKVLAQLIENGLNLTGNKAGELAGIVISAGPGSFTGLRIGYAVAKGLAHALQIPIIEIPTTDVWAYQTGLCSEDILSVVDARRGELFAALYRWESGHLQTLRQCELVRPEMLRDFCQNPVRIVGSDAVRMQRVIVPHLPEGSQLHRPAPAGLPVWALAALGYQKFQEKTFSDVAPCEPSYLRTFKGAS
jgi:tRNA threonylcarbamoyladenosine biosynthesis protein TsaB